MLKLCADVEGIDVARWQKLALWKRLRMVRSGDVVHFFGARFKWLENLALRLRGAKVVVHFIGSDVLRLREAKWRKRLEARILSKWTRVAAVSENLVRELAELGISAELVPFVVAKVNRSRDKVFWPPAEPFRFLCYVPPGKTDFYGWPKIVALAEEFGDLEFWALGLGEGDRQESDPKNIRLLGWREDMEAVLAQVHALLRPTVHDGLSNMVVEAMSYGRHVVYSGVLPFARRALTLGELREAVRQVASEKEPNWAGFKYASAAFSAQRICSGLLRLYGASPQEPNEGGAR